MFIFVEWFLWFRFVGEQVGFKVLVYFSWYFGFLNFHFALESPEFQILKIFPLFFRSSRDKIIS